MTEVATRIAEALNGKLPRENYFQRDSGPMFCWTVERDTIGDDQGYFYAYTFYPRGPGSRTGNAQRWELSANSLVRRRKRKDAKAIALKRFRDWERKAYRWQVVNGDGEAFGAPQASVEKAEAVAERYRQQFGRAFEVEEVSG